MSLVFIISTIYIITTHKPHNLIGLTFFQDKLSKPPVLIASHSSADSGLRLNVDFTCLYGTA